MALLHLGHHRPTQRRDPDAPEPAGHDDELLRRHRLALRRSGVAACGAADARQRPVLAAVGHGATNVISDLATFDPADYLALVDRHRVTHAAFLAPTMLRLVNPDKQLSWAGDQTRCEA